MADHDILVEEMKMSVSEALRYERRLGISVHHAAAIEIARRGMSCSVREKPWAGKIASNTLTLDGPY